MRRRNGSDQGSSDSTPTESPGQAAYREGRERFLANDIDGAIERFEEAARLMPQNAQVQKQLGRAHMRAGHVPAGVRAYQRYLELAPNAGDRAIIERLIDRAQ
jgi:serine/threonine-protein kinase